ncbi:Reverse transcriptase domain-containing protein [Aphis craccivora]|uniref:Reverse transcriptase domain-containing protein n=1 Tax=Aphis craccivora TaxID=307492 RepID=A0A6G0Y7W0_APHCR|nr:Reverse transcriptase domain-containing protein [Aphis craccivora]
MNCLNYRDISLLNTTYKVLSNIILNRLKPYAKEIVGEYQAGFTAGKSATDQIHVIKQITEKSHEFDKDVYLLFVDFKQAYDLIARSTSWNVMVELVILAKLVRMVKACMKNSRCKVKFNSVLSKEFTVTTGVRQGDALSPILFNIALESVVKEVLQNEPQGLNIGQGKQVFLAAYADDIVVITDTKDSLKRTTDILIDVVKKIGLIINENKTKFMIVSRREHPQNALTVKDLSFERVRNFKPIVLYACGAWAKFDENKLMIFERKVQRKIFGPKRNDEGSYEIRSNRELNALYDEPNIVSTLKSQRIRWAGHVWRAEVQLISIITKWKPEKSRPRGRPRQRWEDRVKEDLRMLGVRSGEEQAAHREAWKEIAEAAMGLNGLD